MPAIRHSSKRKPPPEGFSDIEDDLLIFANKMKDAQNKPPPPGPKHMAQWEIFQIAHQRSRYVYDLYYEKEAISKQLYEWLLKNGYADAMLIAKWKKQGYEKVSCHFAFCSLNLLFRYTDKSIAMLPALRSNQRNQLQQHLHLPSTQGSAKRRQRHAVC
jgi:bud site selection protein 31